MKLGVLEMTSLTVITTIFGLRITLILSVYNLAGNLSKIDDLKSLQVHKETQCVPVSMVRVTFNY